MDLRTCCRRKSFLWWLFSAVLAAQVLSAQSHSAQPANSQKLQGASTVEEGAGPEPTAGSEGAMMGGAQINHDPNLADVAWEYLESLLLERFDKAATFLTPESHYQDFSMEFFGREMIDLKSGQAITQFWKESSQASGTVEVRFDADQFFVAGPNVYFIGTGFVTNEGKAWGVNAELLEFDFTQISHIRLVDGKVTYHADHVDYAAAFDQLSVYREKFGPYVPDGKN